MLTGRGGSRSPGGSERAANSAFRGRGRRTDQRRDGSHNTTRACGLASTRIVSPAPAMAAMTRSRGRRFPSAMRSQVEAAHGAS